MEPAAVDTMLPNQVLKVMTVDTWGDFYLELWGDFKEEAVSGQALNNGGEFTNKEISKGWGKGDMLGTEVGAGLGLEYFFHSLNKSFV